MTSTNWSGFNEYSQVATAFGPPGMEGPVREVMSKLLRPYARVIETDRIGNLYAVMGPDEAPTVMLSAHMDEVALVVSGVTERGFIRVAPQGLLRPRSFCLQPVAVLGVNGPVQGIANIARQHGEALISDVLVDVGARSVPEVRELGVLPGDRVCFSPQIRALGADMIVGKAADDRVGLYVLAAVARGLARVDLAAKVVLVCAVQEEGVDTFVAWAGAHVAAQRLDPALWLGIDTVDSCDCVSEVGLADNSETSLADGVGILRGAQDLHPGLVDHLLARARNHGVQHQIIPLAATAADYTRVSRAREGVPCAGLAIPIRHPHSSSEIFLWRTVEDAVDLVLDVLSEPLELLHIAAQSH